MYLYISETYLKILNFLSVISSSLNIVNLISTLTESKIAQDVSENRTCLLDTNSIVLQQDKVTDPKRALLGLQLRMCILGGANCKIVYVTVS